jgi:membrane-associated phospholipid phosphatase
MNKPIKRTKESWVRLVLSKFMPIDLISYAYILINLIYVLLGRNRIPGAGEHLGMFAGIALILFLLIVVYNENRGWLLTFLRNWYPFILFAYFFEFSTIANLVFFNDFIDPFFLKIDNFIFGYQPVLAWGQRFDNLFIDELFYFSYFSYYLVVPGIAFLLYFKKREYFSRYAFTITFVFYLCYLTYNVLPVMGGKYLPGVPEMITSYEGGLFQHIMAFIYRGSNHSGSAFPSSHVAVTVAVNIAALQYFRRIGYWLIPLTILLSISTVYCHYHYFIDTVFGVFYGLGFYLTGTALFSFLSRIMKKKYSRETGQESLQ